MRKTFTNLGVLAALIAIVMGFQALSPRSNGPGAVEYTPIRHLPG
jgi:hypothetical protein